MGGLRGVCVLGGKQLYATLPTPTLGLCGGNVPRPKLHLWTVADIAGLNPGREREALTPLVPILHCSIFVPLPALRPGRLLLLPRPALVRAPQYTICYAFTPWMRKNRQLRMQTTRLL